MLFSTDDGDEDEDADEILLHAGNLLSAKSDSLPRGIIDIGTLKDANCSKPLNVSIVISLITFSWK